MVFLQKECKMKVITEIRFQGDECEQIDKVMSTLTTEGWSVKNERTYTFEYKGETTKTITFVLTRTI